MGTTSHSNTKELDEREECFGCGHRITTNVVLVDGNPYHQKCANLKAVEEDTTKRFADGPMPI